MQRYFLFSILYFLFSTAENFPADCSESEVRGLDNVPFFVELGDEISRSLLRSKGYWTFSKQAINKYQGYKFHISAPKNKESMLLIAQEVIPVLIEHSISYKLVSTAKRYIELKKGDISEHKFITIYTQSYEEFKKIIELIGPILKKLSERILFPIIEEEESFRREIPGLFFRYGSFLKPITHIDKEGEKKGFILNLDREGYIVKSD